MGTYGTGNASVRNAQTVSDQRVASIAGASKRLELRAKDRDAWIGWDANQRRHGLPRVANNARFLIVPWVQVPHLASHLLGRVARRIDADWRAKYGHGIELLETFVDRERFRGTCYRAAGWIHVGATAGRSRNDRDQTLSVPVKDIYLRPLHEDFRRRLCG